MIKYKHSFHAGNHGDILKHLTLVYLLEHMKSNISSPITVIDSHSSNGRFFYNDKEVLSSGEASAGISKILSIAQKSSTPKQLHKYLEIIQTYSKNGCYPGSPEIERIILRKFDHLYLCDINPDEILKLQNNMEQKPFIQSEGIIPVILNKNGFDVVDNLTPPQTEYGMVLIDPPYDKNDDFYDSQETICKVIKKWPKAIIMLWYPINTNQSQMLDKEAMINQIINSENAKTLDIQLLADSYENACSKNKKMYGSGVLILNPPNGLEEDIKATIPWIQKNLSESGSWSISSK